MPEVMTEEEMLESFNTANVSEETMPGLSNVSAQIHSEIEKRRAAGLVPGLSLGKFMEIVDTCAANEGYGFNIGLQCFESAYNEPAKRWVNTWCDRDLEEKPKPFIPL